MDFGCQFAVLKTHSAISSLHTSQNGHPGPYPDSEEEKVITLRKVTFARQCFWKEIIFVFLTVVTAGVYWLILRWSPNLMIEWRYEVVEIDDETAQFALLESVDKEKEIVPIMFLHRDSSGHWNLHGKDYGTWAGTSKLKSKKMSEGSLLLGIDNPACSAARMMTWRHIHLWYDPLSNGWYEVSFSAAQGDYDYLHEVAWKLCQGSKEESRSRQHTYGKNVIQVEVEKFSVIALQQALTPFVVFQVYAVIVWFCEYYFTYSVVIVLMTAGTVLYSAYQIQRSQKSLQDLAKCEGVVLRASFRDRKWQKEEVWSSELVPGDLIEVTPGLVCPCDLVLLSGQCIANEAMLTGESAPVIKESLPLEGRDFNPQTNRAMKHMLLSGSSMIQTKASVQHRSQVSEKHSIWELDEASTPVLAMVLRTGCGTAKGKLIQTIQYPQDTRGFAHRQKEEAEGFVMFLFALTIVSAIWFLVYATCLLGFSTGKVIIDTLDLTTILIPAALPLVLSVGVVFAFESLKKKHIHSSSTTHIVTAGHVDCICYDKTGTLTNEGDTFVGVYAVQGNAQEASFGQLTRNLQDLPQESVFSFVLAACHSLSYLMKEGEEKGELIGESLELEMFKASSWKYFSIPEQIENAPTIILGREVPALCNTAFLPPEAESTFLAVLKIFPFDADLRTMSTAVLAFDPRTKDAGRPMLLVKGAPEVIRNKCVRSSLPTQYDSFLEQLAADGYRVLGCAVKELDGPYEEVLQKQRSMMESDLTFCGFLLMGNQLKPETLGVLSQVHEVGLRQCMVTGDNVLTALSVAKQCGQAFLASDEVCILDYPDYHQGQPQELSLSSFSVAPISAQDVSKSDAEFDAITSFEDILWTLQSQPEKLSLAVSGNAFSALLDMHEVERPDDFEEESGVRSRLNTLASHFSQQDQEDKETPLELILMAANIFARFKPHEKQMLMSVLQKRSGYYVCMVGDGANDSFALKTADVGLSICSNVITEENVGDEQGQVTAAPSIAAPFSTPTCHIGALVDLLCEGRGALACTNIAFRFMLHYGLTGFCAIMILYENDMTWSDPMWVWGDLFVCLPLAILLNMTKCGSKLVAGIPETSILSWRFATKILGHLAIILSTQILAVVYVRNQDWYVSYDVGTFRMKSMEVTVVFWVATGQYITSAITLAHNYGGFRAQWWTNKPFALTICLLIVLQCTLILCNHLTFLQNTLFTVEFPLGFCWMLIGYMVLTCLIHVAFEAMCPRKAVQKRFQIQQGPQHASAEV